MGVLSERQALEEYFRLYNIKYDDLVREHQESRELQVLKPNDLVVLESTCISGNNEVISARPVKSFGRFGFEASDNIDLVSFKDWFSKSSTPMLFVSYTILNYDTDDGSIELAYIFLNKKEFVLNYRCSDNTFYRVL